MELRLRLSKMTLRFEQDSGKSGTMAKTMIFFMLPFIEFLICCNFFAI